MPNLAKNTRNNFDLIRLAAAGQVALGHSIHHLYPHDEWFGALLYFPGVPVFFFVSGYLIYGSFDNIENKTRTHRLTIFFTNRVLRLYPALIVCFFLTLLAIYLSGYLRTVEFTHLQFATWIATALTFFQFYNPDFLRGYATGVANGSLWTISVELQFYLLTPLIFILMRRHKRLAVALFVVLMFANLGNTFLNPKVSVGQKLINVSFAPWIYMFLVGAYVSTSKSLHDWALSLKWSPVIVLYLIVHYISAKFNLGIGNEINPVAFLLLVILLLKMAYSNPELTYKLLRKNDISYGVYIYHNPIVNVLLYKHLAGSLLSVFATMALTLLFAFGSWKLVERPALHLKKIALRRN
jgi:peptidoglycan/LPS O-acetylase OafA/YrhL